MYIYIYVCVYLYMYICAYRYLCICVQVFMCVGIYGYMDLFIYVYMCICISVYMQMYMYRFVCVCIYVSTFICTCTLWGSVDGEMTFIKAASKGKFFHEVADSLYDDVERYFCSRFKIRQFVQWKTLKTVFDSKLDIRKP